MRVYWRVKFGALAHYLEHWRVPAHFYGLVFGRRVFVGLLIGDAPKENTEQ